MGGGRDHGSLAPGGVFESAVEQYSAHAGVPVFFVDREEGEYPHALAHERQRHTGHAVAGDRDPGAFWILFQGVPVSALPPLYLFGSAVTYLIFLLGGRGEGETADFVSGVHVFGDHGTDQDLDAHMNMLARGGPLCRAG